MIALRTAFVLFLALSGYAQACTPRTGASSIEVAPKFRYAFVAEIIADPTKPEAHSGSRRVGPALLRVIEAEAGEPPIGAILSMDRLGPVEADCSRKVHPITRRDFSEGARLRVRSNALDRADEIYYVD
jgi:hypothetical protein